MTDSRRPHAALLPLGFAVIAVALAATLGHVKGAAWPVLLDCATLGATLGALAQLALAATRRRPLPWRTAGIATALGLAGGAHLVLAPAGPAVMIVLVDCMRADRLDNQRSPHMARMASSGWRFETARSAAPWTRSSVPSLLSGRWPVEHGLYRVRPAPDQLADGVRLIAQEFQDAGWDTAAFARQAQLDAAFGMGRGYDRYSTTDGRAATINLRFLAWHLLHRTQPRFVYLHYLDVHLPYRPKGRFKPKDLPETQLRLGTASGWRASLTRVRDGRIRLTEDDRRVAAALYDGEIRQVDSHIGDLLSWLEADGSLDRTWLVLTADHGEMLGEHEDLSHMRTPWEVLLRVPLVIRPPGGLVTGLEIPDPVRLVDVMPTLLEANALPVPAGLAGRSLLPLTRGEALPPVPSFAEEWSRPVRRASVVWLDWKLIEEGEQIRLYNLSTDPGEITDLASQHPDQVAMLRAMLADYYAMGSDTPSGPAPEISAETLEGLEAMGYMD